MGASLSSPSKETTKTTPTKSTIEKIEINRKLFFGRLPSSSCPINNKKEEEEDTNKFEDYAINIINNNINNSLNIYEPIWSTNSYIYNYCNNSNDDDDVQQQQSIENNATNNETTSTSPK